MQRLIFKLMENIPRLKGIIYLEENNLINGDQITHGITVLKKTSLFLLSLEILENGDLLIFLGSLFQGYVKKLCTKLLMRIMTTV